MLLLNIHTLAATHNIYITSFHSQHMHDQLLLTSLTHWLPLKKRSTWIEVSCFVYLICIISKNTTCKQVSLYVTQKALHHTISHTFISSKLAGRGPGLRLFTLLVPSPGVALGRDATGEAWLFPTAMLELLLWTLGKGLSYTQEKNTWIPGGWLKQNFLCSHLLQSTRFVTGNGSRSLSGINTGQGAQECEEVPCSDSFSKLRLKGEAKPCRELFRTSRHFF